MPGFILKGYGFKDPGLANPGSAFDIDQHFLAEQKIQAIL